MYVGELVSLYILAELYDGLQFLAALLVCGGEVDGDSWSEHSWALGTVGLNAGARLRKAASIGGRLIVESKVYLLVNRLTGAIDSAAHEALAATVTPDSGTGDHNLPQLGEQQRNPCMFYGESFLFHDNR